MIAFYGDVSSRAEEKLIANAENYVELIEELKDQIGSSKYVERIERESRIWIELEDLDTVILCSQ